MKTFLACIVAMLAIAALATEAPAAPDKGIQAVSGRCIPRVVTQRLCLRGRMVTCHYRVLPSCRRTGRRCIQPNVIIPCSPGMGL